jgi:hypothetical protein
MGVRTGVLMSVWKEETLDQIEQYCLSPYDKWTHFDQVVFMDRERLDTILNRH